MILRQQSVDHGEDAGTFFPFRATGTIRYVADGLAHTGILLGLVPAGTGTLLARNLDLPLEAVRAFGPSQLHPRLPSSSHGGTGVG
jgi:Diacylglycerol kinase catalytic domain